MQPNATAIRRYRLEKGYSQAQLAERAGVSKSAVQWIDLGKGSRPSTLKKIADALGVEVGDIADLELETQAS